MVCPLFVLNRRPVTTAATVRGKDSDVGRGDSA